MCMEVKQAAEHTSGAQGDVQLFFLLLYVPIVLAFLEENRKLS